MFSGDAEQRVGTEEGNISGAAELHLEDPARLSFEEIHPGKVYVPPKSAKDAAEYKARGNSFYKKKDFCEHCKCIDVGLLAAAKVKSMRGMQGQCCTATEGRVFGSKEKSRRCC